MAYWKGSCTAQISPGAPTFASASVVDVEDPLLPVEYPESGSDACPIRIGLFYGPYSTYIYHAIYPPGI